MREFAIATNWSKMQFHRLHIARIIFRTFVNIFHFIILIFYRYRVRCVFILWTHWFFTRNSIKSRCHTIFSNHLECDHNDFWIFFRWRSTFWRIFVFKKFVFWLIFYELSRNNRKIDCKWRNFNKWLKF